MAAGDVAGAVFRQQRVWELLRLRAKLTIRMFAAEQGRLFIAFMLLVGVLPIMVGIGIGTAVGYMRAPDPWPGRILALVLVGLWLAWMFIPLIAFSMNESMDITRLLVYPLSRLELVTTMLAGTLLDIPTYIMLPLFVAIFVGWAASPAIFILPLALIIAYVHMVLSSQILLTALGGVIASRRFRDVLIVLGAVVGSSCYLIQRALIELSGRFVDAQALERLEIVSILRWLPGGSQAQVIVAADGGDWGTALIWLGYGLALALALAWVWWQLSVRLVTGEGFALRGLPQREPQARGTRAERRTGAARGTRAERRTGAASGTRAERRTRAARAPQWLPADLQQLMAKELRLVWRTPQRRVGLLQGFLLPLIFGGYSFLGSGLPDTLPPWLGFIPPLFGVFSSWVAGANALGVEEKGLPLIAVTPLPRHRFWLAKGLATLPLVALPTLAVALGALYLIPGWQSVVGLLLIPGVVLACLAVVNMGSIFFPYPVRTDGKAVKNTTRGGCISAIGNGLIVPAGISLALLPIAAPVIAAQALQIPALGYAAGLFALIYGAAIFYGLGVMLPGRLMLAREAQILVATRPPQGD